MGTTTPTPNGREVVRLFIAHYVHRDNNYTIKEKYPNLHVYEVTPWTIQTRASVWAYQQYGTRLLGTSLSRYWRDVRARDAPKLHEVGVSVRDVIPTGDLSNYNRVWHLSMTPDVYYDKIEDVAPFCAYEFV
jgi:hypothetical protein